MANFVGEYDSHASTHFCTTNLPLINSSSSSFTPHTFNKIEMAALAATTLHGAKSIAPPPGNTGLRRPSDRFALKSSFFSPSLHLLIPSQLSTAPPTAPRFSMRVASKQAYICRDCGSSSIFYYINLVKCSWTIGICDTN